MSGKGIFLATKQAILAGLNKALKDYQVAALTQKNDRAQYDFIETSDDVLWEYRPTPNSIKKFFFPQDEVLLEYTADGKVTTKVEAKPLVLFGVRPCDLNGLHLLDQAFSRGHQDPNYLAKRELSIVIGMDCQKICDSTAFCYKVESHHAEHGFDLMFYDLDQEFAIQVATEKGQKFLNKYLQTKKGSQADLDKAQAKKEEGFKGLKPFDRLKEFPEIFSKNNDHPVWQEEADRCLSCGSCIMVCPTCYCFDVTDELDLNLKSGKRTRHWDACMLDHFAVVSGNENFRGDAKDRLHHRINRKFNFQMKEYGQSACVGCGRCVRACLVNISPKTIAEKILKSET